MRRQNQRCARRFGPVHAAVLIAATFAPARVSAHDALIGGAQFRVDGRDALVVAEFDALAVAGVDADHDARISYSELDDAIERLFALWKAHVAVGAPGSPTAVRLESHRIIDDHVLSMTLRYSFPATIKTLVVSSTLDEVLGRGHQLVVSVPDGDGRDRALAEGGGDAVTFDLSSNAESPAVSRLLVSVLGVGVVVALLWLRLGTRRRPALRFISRRRSASQERDG